MVNIKIEVDGRELDLSNVIGWVDDKTTLQESLKEKYQELHDEKRFDELSDVFDDFEDNERLLDSELASLGRSLYRHILFARRHKEDK